MASAQIKIRRLFNDNPDTRFTVDEILGILDYEHSKETVQVTISKLKSKDYGYKSYPVLDLVNYSEDYKTPRWGLRGAKEDYEG